MGLDKSKLSGLDKEDQEIILRFGAQDISIDEKKRALDHLIILRGDELESQKKDLLEGQLDCDNKDLLGPDINRHLIDLSLDTNLPDEFSNKDQ